MSTNPQDMEPSLREAWLLARHDSRRLGLPVTYRWEGITLDYTLDQLIEQQNEFLPTDCTVEDYLAGEQGVYQVQRWEMDWTGQRFWAGLPDATFTGQDAAERAREARDRLISLGGGYGYRLVERTLVVLP